MLVGEVAFISERSHAASSQLGEVTVFASLTERPSVAAGNTPIGRFYRVPFAGFHFTGARPRKLKFRRGLHSLGGPTNRTKSL